VGVDAPPVPHTIARDAGYAAVGRAADDYLPGARQEGAHETSGNHGFGFVEDLRNGALGVGEKDLGFSNYCLGD